MARLRAGENVVALARESGMSSSRFAKLCVEAVCELRLYPEVPDTLHQLRASGTPLAAVTNLPGWLVEPLLRELSVYQYFDAVICAARKPSPTGIHKALGNLSRSADGAYYAGDTHSDAQAASRAGVSFAWAAYGYGGERPENTNVVLERFSDVLSL